MTSRVIPVDPFDLVVFGATGDLAHRKILPAMYRRDRDGQLPAAARIIGLARREFDDDSFRQNVASTLAEQLPPAELDADAVQQFLGRVHYLPLDASAGGGWDQLQGTLGAHDQRVRAFYLAVAPNLFGTIVDGIGAANLVSPHSRVVIEKPIGHDAESAAAVNAAVGRVFDEHQIFRIDHYLGKETVQNLMALRFANALFEPLWNSSWIEHVQITVAETVGVESRGGYYDRAGALRDMVQNHLLQLLCLVAMEPPDSLDADGVRDEKRKVLKALRPLTGNDALYASVRGQYAAGVSDAERVSSYADDCGVSQSTTETFVALRAEIENWRWAGVPFYLRTGKRLSDRLSEIVVCFRPIPHSIFSEEAGNIVANRLVLRLQPDDGVRLEIMIKDPGMGGMRLRHVPLDMTFAEEFGGRHPDAYERLIMDVIRGNQTLFMRRDEVDAAWHWIDPICAAWSNSSAKPNSYPAGSWGPAAAVALIERDGHSWYETVEQ